MKAVFILVTLYSQSLYTAANGGGIGQGTPQDRRLKSLYSANAIRLITRNSPI